MSSRAGLTLSTISFGKFFVEPAGQVNTFDPHVLWVPARGRWIATATSFDCAAGHLYLAVSLTSDPTQGWNVYSLDFPGSVPDYPDPGVSSDKVVVSANQFQIVPSGGSCDLSGSGSTGATLDVVDWSALTSGSSINYFEAFSDTLFNWRPANALTATSTLPAVVQIWNASSSEWDIGYATISGTNAGADVVVSSAVDLTTAGVVASLLPPPTPAGATGFTSVTDDGRLHDALWQSGHLWYVSTYPCVPVGDSIQRDCVRATELDTSTATPSQSQDFLVGSAGYDFFFGGIGLATNGTLFIVSSISSASTPISTYATAQLPGDPTNSYRTTLTAVALGATTYSGSRWGDYVGVAQDPSLPDSVWQADEYPNASGRWATKVTRLFVDVTPPTGSFSIAGGATTTETPLVHVTDLATDTETGVSAMRVSNDGATWDTLAYATSFFWDITAPAYGGTIPSGIKSVTMEWQDGAGNWSAPAVQSITLLPGSTYHPLPPTRILDTRHATGLAGPFTSGVPRELAVAGLNGVDSKAIAITGNLTVTGQTRAGYVSLTTDSESAPASSTINFPLGDTRANGVTVALAGDGGLWATYVGPGGSASLVFDVTGYFTP